MHVHACMMAFMHVAGAQRSALSWQAGTDALWTHPADDAITSCICIRLQCDHLQANVRGRMRREVIRVHNPQTLTHAHAFVIAQDHFPSYSAPPPVGPGCCILNRLHGCGHGCDWPVHRPRKQYMTAASPHLTNLQCMRARV